ncbi:MAG: hypothetical protein ACD_21C00158G0007 [uncultured bacterium]|nr:MAG: hypothetical protein ACD_21C00158G0007 [uncultured bacterium]
MQQTKHMKLANHSKRLLKAFYYSACGLKTAFQDHIAFKQAAFLTIIVIPLALILGTTAVEKVILIGSWSLVLFMEIINSAIEMLVDRISLEIHPLSKKIKDMSSAAVLLAIVNAVIVWTIILVDNFW